MKRQERSPELQLALGTALDGFQANLWTAIPGIIVDVQPAAMTCSVQPSVQSKYTNPRTQVEQWVSLPMLINCPLVFPQGGGFALTFPVVAGDEVLVVFASRCIDLWWQDGGVQPQAEVRMHDISDGFALAGVRSVPRALADWSQTDVELRSDDGTAAVAISPDKRIAVTSPDRITLTAPNIVMNGTLALNGSMVATGNVTGNGTSLHTHIHSGVDTGAGNSGPPV